MRLLICTQKVNKNDPILGFFHAWLLAFAAHFDSITVICLEEGEHNLPSNIKVLSLGKESGKSRIKYISRFYKYIWQEIKNYDSVFVHMNPEYAILGGLFWRVMGKKMLLWYTHREVNQKLRLATLFANVVFSSAPESFRIKTSKIRFLGHGIDTTLFKFNEWNRESRVLAHIGRITPIKHCEVLIKAVSLLGPGWQAEFIGSPVNFNDKKYLESLEKNPQIRFSGSLPARAVADKLPGFFATVNMTPKGGMDKAVLESWAAGCPCFTSNSAFRNVLPEPFIYEFENPRDLADKIIEFQRRSDQEEVIKAISQKIAVEYGLESLISKISTELKK